MLKAVIPAICFVAIMTANAQNQPQFPQATISNGRITAQLFLPDAGHGYYRATRFDWSGQISSLKTAHHDYFGQWFDKYDPKLHDSIMGPVEEFLKDDTSIGYAEAKPGGTFIRVGVGVVRKPAGETKYQRFNTYEIVDPGKWSVRRGADWIEFTHDLSASASAPEGYGYRYTKTIRLKKNQDVMLIEHSLKNTGSKPIATAQYNHNFFVIDGKPSGPGNRVQFTFPLKADQFNGGGGAVEVRGKEIVYLKELAVGQSAYGEFQGFGPSASDYDIRLEHGAAGAGVHITGSLPLSKLVFWSIRTTFCPEAYVDINVAPGGELKWTYTYQFYELPQGGAQPRP
jgi:hypothetical protein